VRLCKARVILGWVAGSLGSCRSPARGSGLGARGSVFAYALHASRRAWTIHGQEAWLSPGNIRVLLNPTQPWLFIGSELKNATGRMRKVAPCSRTDTPQHLLLPHQHLEIGKGLLLYPAHPFDPALGSGLLLLFSSIKPMDVTAGSDLP